MYLTPGERAVLAQIRVLYSIAGKRDQQIKALQMQWTPSHYPAYEQAFAALLAKRLVENSGAQSFRITDAGLRAIGVSAPRPVVPRELLPPAKDVRARERPAKKS
jgi:uncharacterized protein YjhX (UPF0386 family)